MLNSVKSKHWGQRLLKRHQFKQVIMSAVVAFWYRKHPLRWCLYPLSLIYRLATAIRRHYLQNFCQQHVAAPVIVVGNLTLGGVGKTPLVIALAQYFHAQGLRVGIVTRGYHSRISKFPYAVTQQDSSDWVGDEALLLAKKTNATVVVAKKRMQAIWHLRHCYSSDIIISDDGLQHYAMGRAIEIAVIDGMRGLGNGLCLPAGPLREKVGRLKQVDFVVVNTGVWHGAYSMQLIPRQIVSLTQGFSVLPHQLPLPIAAVAGIGHPERFFNTLDSLSLRYSTYAFPDHHRFSLCDFNVPEQVVVMTEKDAVKCQHFATDKMYALAVEALLGDDFWSALIHHPQLKRLNLL